MTTAQKTPEGSFSRGRDTTVSGVSGEKVGRLSPGVPKVGNTQRQKEGHVLFHSLQPVREKTLHFFASLGPGLPVPIKAGLLLPPWGWGGDQSVRPALSYLPTPTTRSTCPDPLNPTTEQNSLEVGPLLLMEVVCF